jgi:hypothetical protein
MTNTDVATEILHRLERVSSQGLRGTMELPRDSDSPPTITLHKMVGWTHEFTDLWSGLHYLP